MGQTASPGDRFNGPLLLTEEALQAHKQGMWTESNMLQGPPFIGVISGGREVICGRLHPKPATNE